MVFNVRRPWWHLLFLFTIAIAVVMMSPHAGYSQGSGIGDVKVDYHQQVEGGHSVWLNPGERYVPGSLRITEGRSQPVRRQPAYHPPAYQPPNYAGPTHTPPNYYAPPAYYPPPSYYQTPGYYDQTPRYYQPPAIRQPRYAPGIDYGVYRRDCDTCGVKVDGALTTPTYRNWSERRGAMQSGGDVFDPLDEKKQADPRE